MMAEDIKSARVLHLLRRTWAKVRWKIAAIILLTGTSTILIACLAVAALNVVVRRESSNVVEKQIQVLVQASRSVGPAMVDTAGSCTVSLSNSGGFKPLLAYTDEVFPQAQASLTVDGPGRVQSMLVGAYHVPAKRPDWLPETDFAGVVVDGGRLEIRNVVTRNKDGCKITAIFSLPLGSELAKRLSSAANMGVTAVSPSPFRVHSLKQRLLRTIEDNFIPGMSRHAAVVLTVHNYETGALEDWIGYTVRPSYFSTFEDLARLGRQLANWVWLGAALAVMVFLMDAVGVWICIHLGGDIATAIDDLSRAAREIGDGNFAWRTPMRSNDQLGDLSCTFNEMVISLERLRNEEVAALRLKSELQVAQSVQEYLFPRVVPVVPGATVAGRTLAARSVGGDLYDFFDLGKGRIGILCGDVSGKGIPAALMMANLQAVARVHLNHRTMRLAQRPEQFVEILNEEIVGRFGDNRYVTLFWAEYNAETAVLTYVNAGHPEPIVISSAGAVQRLNSGGFPIGMFGSARYTSNEVQMRPGTRVVIFSDGLTDAHNSAEQEFGDERVIASCKTMASALSAEAVAETLMQAAAEWSSGTDPFDDTTVVVVDVTHQSAGA